MVTGVETPASVGVTVNEAGAGTAGDELVKLQVTRAAVPLVNVTTTFGVVD